MSSSSSVAAPFTCSSADLTQPIAPSVDAVKEPLPLLAYAVHEPSNEPLPFIMANRPLSNLGAQLLPCSTPSGPGEILEEEVPASKMACITKALEKVRPHFTCAGNPVTLTLEKVQPYFNSIHNSAHPVTDALEKVKPHFRSMQTSMRPWDEFCVLAKPQGDGWKRLQVNVRHYRSNYTVSFFALSSAAVLFSPPSLFAIAVLTAAWMTILKKSEDPEWTLHIGSYALSKTKQWIILDTLTGLVLLFVVGKHLVFAAFITSLAATGHAVMHPLPESIADTFDTMETGSLHQLPDGVLETPVPLPDHILETPIALENGSLYATGVSLYNMD